MCCRLKVNFYRGQQYPWNWNRWTTRMVECDTQFEAKRELGWHHDVQENIQISYIADIQRRPDSDVERDRNCKIGNHPINAKSPKPTARGKLVQHVWKNMEAYFNDFDKFLVDVVFCRFILSDLFKVNF